MQELTNSLPQRIFFRFCRGLCWFYFKIVWRLDVHGVENIPTEGGVVLAANHRSYADPPLVGVSVPRDVHFLAKEELFRFRPFGWLIAALNAHPLNRKGGDVAAFKIAKQILEAGGTLIVFPEGRRNRTTTLGKPKAGAALLARMTGCPVVPVYVRNSAEMILFKKISVYFGPPLSPENFGSSEALVNEVMKKISDFAHLYPHA